MGKSKDGLISSARPARPDTRQGLLHNYDFRDTTLDNNTPLLVAPVYDKSVITLSIKYDLSRYLKLHSDYIYSSSDGNQIRVGMIWDW